VRKDALGPEKLRKVIDFIEANLDTTIGLSDLAVTTGLSPHHFARGFRAATGVSPYQFVLQRRLLRAQALLAETQMPISEVALAVGFSSQSRLTSAFRTRFQDTPAAYRRRTRG
jgi:AraC family transcriptional regulator